MTKELDEILYDALCADSALMEAVSNRVRSTCFEVSPDEKDNTPLPCIIVTDDGWQNTPGTKDNVWESEEDTVTASIEIDAKSPKQVKRLVRMARRAIANHIATIDSSGEDIPYLDSIQSDGIDWDWKKPCYYEIVSFTCKMENDYEVEVTTTTTEEQTDNN